MLIYIQLVVAVLLIVAILLQQKGQALGSAFGGGGEGGGFYATKRGFEKKLFWATVFLGTLFILLSLLNLVI